MKNSFLKGAAGLIALALLLVGAHTPAEAQWRSGPAGRGYFAVGAQGLDVSELNARFTAADYPAVDDRLLSLGGGGLVSRGRLLMGGEGHGVIGPRHSAQNDDLSVRVAGGYGMFVLGYALHRQGGLDVFPHIGLGGGGLSITIDERSAPTFDDVLENPRRGARIGSGQFLLNAGLGLDYTFRGQSRRARRGGPVVGVRAGYMYAPMTAEWVTGTGTLPGGPDAGFTGPYLRLVIGGGGR